MTRSEREAIADAFGRELANARAAWRKEREIIIAEHRQIVAELRAEVADLKLKLHEQASSIKDGAQGPQGEKGERGERGEDGKQGETGAQGPAGESGPQGPAGERGADGRDGNDGADGKDGAPGQAGQFPIPRAWKAQIHYAGQIVTHDGSTWQATRDTAAAPPHEDWNALALKGLDAPVGDVCGKYDPQKRYRKFDLVNTDNSEWRAKHDDPGPCPGDGWAMSARQGKPGPKGERGERGERGQSGAQLVSRKLVGFKMIDTLSDGSTIELDLRGAFERYHYEAA
jgi:hypothetical protein